MAQDQVDVMKHFGFDRFAVVGQDRGGRVTHRMALDHADKVTKAVLIDIVPTYYLYTHVNIDFVQAYFHWFNYLRASPVPENELLAQRAAQAGRELSPAQAEYQRANGTPEGVHGMCEDYRAGASIDLVHDAADLDEKVRCPLQRAVGRERRDGSALRRARDLARAGHERRRAKACPAATTCKKVRRASSIRSSRGSCARKPRARRVAQTPGISELGLTLSFSQRVFTCS